MKRIILTILSFISVIVAESSSIVNQGDQAYNEGRFEEAIRLYQSSAQNEGTSAWLYYNLGNAYYRSDSIAKAILNYERALKLDPTNDNARNNLEFVNSRYNLSRPSESATTVFISRLTSSMHANTWAIISLILFTLTLIATASYFLLSKPLFRKIGFFSGLILLPLTIASIAIAFNAHSLATSKNGAIVTIPSAQLSTVPSKPLTPSQQAFTVPEGYRLEIVDSIASTIDNGLIWYEVKVEDDSRAWVCSSDVEII